MFTESELATMHGVVVRDARGLRVGRVRDVYLDDETRQAAWATVACGLFSSPVRVVPLDGAALSGRVLRVAVSKAAVLGAPNIVEDDHLGSAEEDVLRQHYGLAPSASDPDPVPGAPGADRGLLDHAAQSSEEARHAAAKADPIGDGSYAGDASKEWLVDTPDLDPEARPEA